MALQGAPLREALLAKVALVRPHPRVRPRVPLEVERVVEALPAEGAEVTLHVAVTLHVTVEQPLQVEVLAAHAAGEAVVLPVKASKGALSE